MSRSRKKFPSGNDYSRNYTKWAKRQASKKVRHTENIPNGKQYKKVFCSWDIFDYKFIIFDIDYFINNDFEETVGKGLYRWYMK